MSGLLYYSTNPWITFEIVRKFRGGVYFVWCSEFYDPRSAAASSSASMIAPSSSPKGIYDTLLSDSSGEDVHSALIRGYRKTFKRLANAWLADGAIDKNQRDEIIATVQSNSWAIWRPVLFLIPQVNIADNRIIQVRAKQRAAYGPELQIHDLRVHEFEMIER